MGNEKDIIIKDGLSVNQMRKLLEITNVMTRCINEEEFNQILSVYGKATIRLLGENK